MSRPKSGSVAPNGLACTNCWNIGHRADAETPAMNATTASTPSTNPDERMRRAARRYVRRPPRPGSRSITPLESGTRRNGRRFGHTRSKRAPATTRVTPIRDKSGIQNTWLLGLIYARLVAGNDGSIKMTLRAVGCPIGPAIAGEMENKLQSVGAERFPVAFVWSPPWSPPRLTDDGRLALQSMGYPV